MSIINKNKRFFSILGLLILFTINVIFIISKFNKNPTSLDGLWRGFHNETMIVFNLNEENKCSLEFYEYIGILENSKLKISVQGECEIDYTKRPIPIKLGKAKKSTFIKNPNPSLMCNINCSIEPIYFITDINNNGYKNSIKLSFFSKSKRLNYISFGIDSHFSLFRVPNKFSS